MTEANSGNRRDITALRARGGSSAAWQESLRNAVRDLDELAELLEIDADRLRAAANAESPFGLLVPRSFIARMRKGDLEDPLLLQVLPSAAERLEVAGFVADPLDEHGLGTAGVMRKYRGRALLITTGACPVHCRYCFRREYPYADRLAARHNWEDALADIRHTPETTEVILSGGDPLCLGNHRLGGLVERIEQIGHVERLRFHTRFPIVIPERIDTELLEAVRRTRLATIFVVHANHANEIDSEVTRSLKLLSETADLVLNQSVLLRGVNDTSAALAELSRRLFAAGVVPYYLHLLDRVTGTSHYEVAERDARQLLAETSAELPGYLVPKLVREVPDALSKLVVA